MEKIIITEEYRNRVLNEGVFFNCLNLKTNGGRQVRTAKFFLIQERGHKCECCGNTEWLNQPIPLTLDHKDGNSDNWDYDNCRLLCKNCDALQPTYAGRNKGKSSNVRNEYRKKRYSQGLMP